MVTETLLEEIAVQLAARLRGREYGSVQVRDVVPGVITDVDGYLAVKLEVQLNDPDGETWPHDDLLDLRRDARAEARTFPEPFPVYLKLRPTTELEQEPEPDDDDEG